MDHPLVEFLTNRLNEALSIALAVPVLPTETPPTHWQMIGWSQDDRQILISGWEGFAAPTIAHAEHITNHDPVITVDDVVAKQRLLQLHHPVVRIADSDGHNGARCAVCPQEYPCETIRVLGCVYRNHHRYREAEWGPAEQTA